MRGWVFSGMRLGCVLALMLLAGCTDLLAPMYGDPTLIQAPAAYREWYRMAERCSGKTGNFDRVRWYAYPGYLVPHYDALAIHTHYDHKIAVAEYWLTVQKVITHEALHDILGVSGHPAEYYGHAPDYADGKCSAIVVDPEAHRGIPLSSP